MKVIFNKANRLRIKIWSRLLRFLLRNMLWVCNRHYICVPRGRSAHNDCKLLHMLSHPFIFPLKICCLKIGWIHRRQIIPSYFFLWYLTKHDGSTRYPTVRYPDVTLQIITPISNLTALSHNCSELWAPLLFSLVDRLTLNCRLSNTQLSRKVRKKNKESA